MGADVQVEGDAEIQQAVRFGLFHILQAGSRAELRPIAAKGLTGTGYDGHTFWDTEMFVLPVLTYTQPAAVADALRWRHLVIDDAKQRAADLGLAGATFPWRTIRGQECSGYWPAGTAAFHINADIAYAVTRYLNATDDPAFESEVGLELLVETARLWRSLGQHDAAGQFRIEGVTGPDEYSAVKDNNVYTNLMAQHNLRCAADLVKKLPAVAATLGVSPEEAASWRDAAADMYIPYDERLGVHPQHEGFTDYARWDFDGTPPDKYPLLLHYPYFQLYRKQVVKQADLVLAMQLRPDAFTDEQKARNFAYYEALTVRDSSLSACTQAVMAAEVGQLDLAYDYLTEAALMDLADVEHNTADGLHMASLAGAWIALVAGFGGMRAHTNPLEFTLALPAGIAGLTFRLRFQGRKLCVTVRPGEAQYELLDGDPVALVHHGTQFELATDPVKHPIPDIKPAPRPSQPPNRAPYKRSEPPRRPPPRQAGRAPRGVSRWGRCGRWSFVRHEPPPEGVRAPRSALAEGGRGATTPAFPPGQLRPPRAALNHLAPTFSPRYPRSPGTFAGCAQPPGGFSAAPEGRGIVVTGGGDESQGRTRQERELAAADYLTAHGLRILDQNWRCDIGEIDIVAVDRQVFVVCEVKTRSGVRYGTPLEAVTRTKLRRQRRLAVAWLNAHGVRFDQVRIDVVGIICEGTGGFTIEHLKGVG